MAKRPKPKLAVKTAKKPRGKPFGPNNTANLSGRPKGSRNAATRILDEIGIEAAADVLRVVVEQARKKKDMQAAGILLARLWPAPKGRLLEFDLPPVVDAAGVIAALAKIADLLSSGVITVEEASAASSFVGNIGEAVKLLNLEQRLRAVEAQLSK